MIADLKNNVIGRDIGASSYGDSRTEIAKKTLKSFRENGLYTTIRVGEEYIVKKTRIAEKEYRQGLQNFQNLNENGASPLQIELRNHLNLIKRNMLGGGNPG